ncbi:MAG TPA: hypothetical protein VE088_01560 [Gaiellaceae bacterium]|jgi:hypothetical protein|nr:hypothetical protein [Gaiellaceae bacterium]
MKAIPAPALLAALGLVVAGCGSGSKVVSGSITVTGTTTVSNVKAGTVITCKGARLSATVTDALAEVAGSSYRITRTGKVPVPRGNLRLTRSQNGVVTISCTP